LKALILVTLFFLVSCAAVNKQEETKLREKVRHGIVPISETPKKKLSQKLAESSFERGKSLYKTHCLGCHGEKGLGNGPLAVEMKHKPANLSKLAREVRDFKFFMSISQWQGDMPGWKEPFNDSDREDLVAYIKKFR
jgi:mono/diheme cytochrome c family protein